MIVTTNQDLLASWLCKRIKLAPTLHFQCIANVSPENGILGVVGYDGYNGASIQMHSAGDGNWVTRDFLFAAFDYPFNVCKVNVVIGYVSCANVQAVKFNTHLGFNTAFVLEGAHPEGGLMIMTMRSNECKFLRRNSYGQKRRSATST